MKKYLQLASLMVVAALETECFCIRGQISFQSNKQNRVLWAIPLQEEQGDYKQSATQSIGPYTSSLSEENLEQRIQGITAIATDVDGTLLSTDHTLSEITKRSIQRAVKEAAESKSKPGSKLRHFFPATGKTRKGALDSLGPEIRNLLSDLPGVFCQGLYCVDGDGEVVFEKKLPPKAVAASEILAAKFNTTIIGNFQDIIYGNDMGDAALLGEVNALWGEPVPVLVPSLASDGPDTYHKLVFMSNDVDMLKNELRPELEKLAEETEATVTTSFPTILEILPAGCSKALGVEMLCKKLQIDPATQLLALGDAENDKEMLQMAAIGVAMGNGSPICKKAADVVMEKRSDEGAAGLAMGHFSPLREATF